MKMLCFILLLFTVQQVSAQVDLQCNGRDKHAIYMLDYSQIIYRVDSVDTNPTDGKLVTATIPTDSYGLSINNNLDSATGLPTMYDILLNGDFYYHNGVTWRNTHHNSGGGINSGGSTTHIFTLHEGNNKVYSYDGTGTGVPIVSNVPVGSGTVYDVAVDKGGNFYLFFTTNHYIVVYNPSGIPIDTFTTSGNATGTQPGFAILGSRMYVMCNDKYLYEGIKTGNNIHFTQVKYLPSLSIADIAACPEAGEVLAVFNDVKAPHFAIFPNPANDETIIRLDNTAQLQVFDCMGREVLSVNTTGQTEYRFSVSNWTAGVYFVSATSSSGKTAFSKLMVR